MKYLINLYVANDKQGKIKKCIEAKESIWNDFEIQEQNGIFYASAHMDHRVELAMRGLSQAFNSVTLLLEQVALDYGDTTLQIIKDGRIERTLEQSRPYTAEHILAVIKSLKGHDSGLEYNMDPTR